MADWSLLYFFASITKSLLVADGLNKLCGSVRKVTNLDFKSFVSIVSYKCFSPLKFQELRQQQHTRTFQKKRNGRYEHQRSPVEPAFLAQLLLILYGTSRALLLQ